MTSPCWSSTSRTAPTPSSRGSYLGLDPALLLTLLRYVRPEAGLTDASWARLAACARLSAS